MAYSHAKLGKFGRDFFRYVCAVVARLGVLYAFALVSLDYQVVGVLS